MHAHVPRDYTWRGYRDSMYKYMYVDSERGISYGMMHLWMCGTCSKLARFHLDGTYMYVHVHACLYSSLSTCTWK